VTTYHLTVTAVTDDADIVAHLMEDAFATVRHSFDQNGVTHTSANVTAVDVDSEPDDDDRLQALITYLGTRLALDILEDNLQEYPQISEDAKAADRDAGETVIRTSNGDSITRRPAPNPPGFEDGWDGKPKAFGYDDAYDAEYKRGQRNRRLFDAGPPPVA
jgi:hypothetical protein